ncbi:MAG: hypothetical protein BWY70_01815 [Bacteroidetes bacterium ADurb.Bin408]|nr:MAG: hypothetical protein BWY70_01815 [Bacteroidetes bacterium ADurb.Bin408]
MKLTKKAIKAVAETKLEKAVAKWWADKVEYGDDPELIMEDLLQYGCQSGMVADLIYYSDTMKFYKRHREEINGLLYEMAESIGEGPSGVFGDKWNKEDPLALQALNQNLLAWFGFEETARKLAEKLGVDL